VRQDTVAFIRNWLRFNFQRSSWLLQDRKEMPGRRKELQNRILFTWLSEKPQLTKLVLPLLREFSANDAIILGGEQAMTSKLPKDLTFLTFEQTPQVDIHQWKSAYQSCARVWRDRVADLGRRGILNRAVLPLLNYHLQLQSQRVMAFGALLDELKPRAIVTEFDRNTLASCLVLSANVRQIPTFTMFHGTIAGRFGFFPLLADIGLCWGEWHRRKMIEFGTDPKRLIVVGRQSITREILAEGGEVKRRNSIPPERPVALLATNPVSVNKRRALTECFCEAISGSQHVEGVVRLHPSETMDVYSDIRSRYPTIWFTENRELTLDEAFAVADVVVCHSSAFGSEALVKGRPTIVLSVSHSDDRLFHGGELIDLAGCPLAQNSAELLQYVERIVKDEGYRHTLLRNAAPYVKEFCAAYGVEAAGNIANVVRSVIASRHNQ
jgi:hypothetical protein